VKMVADADLSPHHDAVADDGTACDTDLAANNAMPSKTDIVRNVHEVIENSPRSDDGVTGRTAVYRAVRANLDIVFDNDTAKLRNAQSPIPRGHEAETQSADADTGRDPDSGADDGVADAAVCPDCAVVAKHDAAANDGVTTDVATRPDFCAGADDGSGVNSRPGPDDGARIDPRIGGYARLRPTGRIIQKADPGKSELRFGHAHETHASRCVLDKISGRDNGGRMGRVKGVQVLRMIEETEFAGTSRLQRRDIADHHVFGCRIQEFGIDLRGNVRKTKWPEAPKEPRISHRVLLFLLLNVIIEGPRSIVEAAIDIQRRNLDRA
jgi:hypothetical protein